MCPGSKAVLNAFYDLVPLARQECAVAGPNLVLYAVALWPYYCRPLHLCIQALISTLSLSRHAPPIQAVQRIVLDQIHRHPLPAKGGRRSLDRPNHWLCRADDVVALLIAEEVVIHKCARAPCKCLHPAERMPVKDQHAFKQMHMLHTEAK